MDSTRNRRRSFRMDDRIQVWVHPLNEEALEGILQDFGRYRLNYCLKSHFINQREEQQPKFQILKKRNADIAAYIAHLEEQIIELADRLQTTLEETSERRKELVSVNLSADGIRLECAQSLEVGQSVELGLDLPTNSTHIVLIAKVIRCDESGDGKCTVSLEYTHILDEDIEAIIRHLAKLQQIQLQARRAS
ncbi:MAG: hypothetical protein HKN42_03025 [Granulosicoccus sp.]|nr:hypothetical protein [Granulosicoccus sp.]